MIVVAGYALAHESEHVVVPGNNLTFSATSIYKSGLSTADGLRSSDRTRPGAASVSYRNDHCPTLPKRPRSRSVFASCPDRRIHNA